MRVVQGAKVLLVRVVDIFSTHPSSSPSNLPASFPEIEILTLLNVHAALGDKETMLKHLIDVAARHECLNLNVAFVNAIISKMMNNNEQGSEQGQDSEVGRSI